MNLNSRIIVFCDRLNKAGGKAYVVGGSVRDHFLGKESHDVDIVVVGLTMNDLYQYFGNCKVVGNSFPVAIIEGVEVALARKEKKIGEGYLGFTCETENVSLTEDLFRRDLTINAIAYDPIEYKFIDPFDGIVDIKKKILRPVSEHFTEDPLRILRAARFAAQLGFIETLELIRMCEFAKSELHTLPAERIWGELLKALQSPKPSRFFELLDHAGCLETLFPEIAALKDRPQPEKWHPEGDAYIHTLLVLDRARELNADDQTMFAALVHDLGKAVTPDDGLPSHINHEALGVPIIHNMCDRLKVPNSFRDVAIATSREHLNIHRFLDLKTVTRVRLLERLGAAHGDGLIQRVALASQADAQGRGPTFIDKPYPSRQAIINAAAAFKSVSGQEFAHIQDINKIGQKLEIARSKALQTAGLGK